MPTIASLASHRGGGGGQDQEYGPSVRDPIFYRHHLLAFCSTQQLPLNYFIYPQLLALISF
jgi:hypothetical protein